MSPEQLTASFALATTPVTLEGQVGAGTFLRTAAGWVKQLALAQVDTEAERDAIIDVVMKAADVLVAGKFPPVIWGFVRTSIQTFLDEYIDKLPGLLTE